METVSPELQVRLFGSFKLFEEGVEHPLPASSHARSLLAYLFLVPKKTHSRLAVATLLSPDASETNARRLLNQALWHIRSSLPGLLICGPDEIRLAPGYPLTIDVTEFEERIHPYLAGKSRAQDALHDLSQAIEFYQGDLLEGFYEDWTLLERERLREFYFQALEQLIQAYKAAHEYQQALYAALRLIRGDPLRESAQREIIRLHHLLGNGNAAIKHYQDFQQVLRNELGMDPEPETRDLVREISRRSEFHQPPYLPETIVPTGRSLLETHVPEQLPLIGRSVEKRMILARIEAIFLQRGSIVLVEGDPGIGKTRLLQEIRRDLEWRGVQVVWSKVSQHQSTQVDDPLIQAFKSGLSPLRIEQVRSLVRPEQAGLLEETLLSIAARPVHTASSDSVLARDFRQGMARGLADALSLWSQVTPLVIVLEDLHWAQEDTWEMLVELVESLFTGRPAGVGILISIRPEEANTTPWIQAALARLPETDTYTCVDLRPLDRDASGELIRAFLGIQQSLAPVEKRLYQETGGNPLFALESLRLLYAQGRLNRGMNGSWQLEPEAGPVGISPIVESTLARRIEQLPPQTVQVLQVLAVLGDFFDFASLRELCAMELTSLLASLHQLVQAHFLVETAQDYHFTHDLLLQVSYDSIPAEQRRYLHTRAGAILESLHPEQVEVLAYHFEAGQVAERAAFYQEKAGETACQRNAYHQAAHHFKKAIDWAVRADLAPARRYDLLSRHESILDILGERDAQKRELKAMDQLVRCHQMGSEYRLKAQFRWANLLYSLGQYPQSEAVARRALSLAECAGNELAVGQARLSIGSALHGGGHDKEAVPYLQAAISHLHNAGERQAESKAWQTLTVIYADAGQFSRAMEANEASLVLNRLLDDRPALTKNLVMTGWILLEQGNYDCVERYCQEALQISRSLGDRLDEALAFDILGDLWAELGLVGRALEMFDRALEICRFLKEEKLRLSILLERADPMIFFLGDFELAAASINEAEALARSHRLERELAICAGKWAHIDLCRGHLHPARAKLKQAVLQAQRHNCPGVEIWLRHLQVELELAANRPPDALCFLEEAEKLSQTFRLRSLPLYLLADRSAVLLASGRAEEALQASSRAVGMLDPDREGLFIVLYRHSQALSACGRKTEAYRVLSAAAQGVNRLVASLPPQQQKNSRECVPIHRDILLAWESLQPRQVRVSLPESGQALSSTNRDIPVTWTVWLPEDAEIPHKVERRRHQLQRLLAEAARQGAAPAQAHLAEALGVSVRTIAQDLAELKRPAIQ